MPSDVFEDCVEKVISPAIQTHYDNLGIGVCQLRSDSH